MDANRGSREQRPLGLVILIATNVIFAPMGYGAALELLLSPSGKGMGLSLDLLENTPVGDFTLVGLFFLAFYGILPTVATYGLLTKARWHWTDAINGWTGQHWSWTASAALGVILLLWIAVELAILGFLSGLGGILQIMMSALGVWILALCMLPMVRSNMKLGASGS